MPAFGHECGFHFFGQEGLARGIGTDEEDERRAVAVVLGAVRQGDVARDPGEIPLPGLNPQGLFTIRHHLGDDAAPGHVVLINQDEPARGLEIGIQIKGERGLGLDGHVRHFVALHDRIGLLLIQREVVGVHDAVNFRDAAFDFVRGQPDQIGFLHLQGPAPEPEQVGAKGRGDERQGMLVTDDLPALDENLFVQGNAHGLPGLGLRWRRFDVECFQRLHDRAFIRR